MNVPTGGPLHGLGLRHPPGEISHMMKITDLGRGIVRCLGLAAATMLVLSAAANQSAEALSLINPGVAPTAKYASGGLTTEVRGGHGGHGGHGGGGHGGGGGFHRGGGGGGGVRTGGAVFHGGGFRAGHVFRDGGLRHGGFAFRHHRFHRHFYYASSYYDYPYRRCRIIRTYYGPRRICHYRHWHHRGYPFW
jgi:hypothetical protein